MLVATLSRGTLVVKKGSHLKGHSNNPMRVATHRATTTESHRATTTESQVEATDTIPSRVSLLVQNRQSSNEVVSHKVISSGVRCRIGNVVCSLIINSGSQED